MFKSERIRYLALCQAVKLNQPIHIQDSVIIHSADKVLSDAEKFVSWIVDGYQEQEVTDEDVVKAVQNIQETIAKWRKENENR